MLTANRLLLTCFCLGLSLSSLNAQAATFQSNSQPRITAERAQATIAQQRNRKRFVPPKLKLDRGIPSSRGHNASRGCITLQEGPGLTLLVPEYVETKTSSRGQVIENRYAMGLTATAQPSFWAYVAVDQQADNTSLEFVLRDTEGRKLYSEMLAVPSQSGFIEIIPTEMPPLEAGVDYHWFLKQKSRCGALAGLFRESGEAWIRYEEPSSTLSDSDETIYWHDALTAAADDKAAFGELLEAIGLGELL